MNTFRYGLVLLAIVACVVLYELRYAKVRDLVNFVSNDTLHLQEEEEDSDLENAFKNVSLIQQRGEKESHIENVTANTLLLNRIKRSIVNYGECPEGLIKLKIFGKLRCVTCDKYSELTGDDC